VLEHLPARATIGQSLAWRRTGQTR
jgi:hypothetical protein